MEEQRIKDKLDFFMDEKIEVHVKLLDKTFLNGFIEKELREGVYWFKDRKLDGVFLFLRDVWEVEKLKEFSDFLKGGGM